MSASAAGDPDGPHLGESGVNSHTLGAMESLICARFDRVDRTLQALNAEIQQINAQVKDDRTRERIFSKGSVFEHFGGFGIGSHVLEEQSSLSGVGAGGGGRGGPGSAGNDDARNHGSLRSLAPSAGAASLNRISGGPALLHGSSRLPMARGVSTDSSPEDDPDQPQAAEEEPTPGGCKSSSSRHVCSGLTTRRSARAATIVDFAEGRSFTCLMFGVDSPVRILVDLITLLALVYDAFMVPFDMAWRPTRSTVLLVGNIITAAIWTVDMFVSLNSAYYDDGRLVTNRQRVIKRYFLRWGLIDIVVNTTDWFSIAAQVAEVNGVRGFGQGEAGLIRLLKAPRVARIFALTKSRRLTERLHRLHDLRFHMGSGSRVLSQVFKLALVIFWINHLLCCVFYAIGSSNLSDTGSTWLDTVYPLSLNYREHSMLFQYTTALHWSMTQMTPGSMEVFPQNSAERIVSVVSIMFGLLFGTSLISLLSAELVKVQIQQKERTETVLMLRKFLSQQNIAQSFAHQVEKVVLDRLSISSELREQEVKALALIPAYLRAELKEHMFGTLMLRHPMLRTVSRVDNALRDVCSKTEHAYLARGDELFSSKQQRNSANSILKGEVSYHHPSGVHHQDFGKGTWICEASLWMQWSTVGRAEATATCDMTAIRDSSFFEVFRESRSLTAIRTYSVAFQRLVATLAPDEMTDIGFMDEGEALAFMPRDMRVRQSARVLRAHARTHMWTTGILMTHTINTLPVDVKRSVEDGSSALMFSQDGDYIEIINEAAVRLQCIDTGCTLLQIGEVKGDSLSVCCRLPCMPIDLDFGSSHRDLVDQLLATELSAFTSDRSAMYEKKEIEVYRNHRHAVLQRTIRRVFTAECNRFEAVYSPGRKVLRSKAVQCFGSGDFVPTNHNGSASAPGTGSRFRPSFFSVSHVDSGRGSTGITRSSPIVDRSGSCILPAAGLCVAGGSIGNQSSWTKEQVRKSGTMMVSSNSKVSSSNTRSTTVYLVPAPDSDPTGPPNGKLFAWMPVDEVVELLERTREAEQRMARWLASLDMTATTAMPERHSAHDSFEPGGGMAGHEAFGRSEQSDRSPSARASASCYDMDSSSDDDPLRI